MSTTVKWGLITGMVYVIFSLIANLLGLQEGGGFSAMTLLSNGALMAVSFITIYMGIKETKEVNLQGFLTFGQGFRAGMGITLIASLIVLVFTLIYLYLIDPSYIDKMMEMAEESWDKQGMGEEQKEMARKYTSMFMTPWLVSLMAMVSCLVWGLIKSLIGAAMLKKDPPIVMPTV